MVAPQNYLKFEELMKNILLLGAGKIGEVIAALLGSTGDYMVTAADNSDDNLKKIKVSGNVETLRLNFSDHEKLKQALAGKFAVISVSMKPGATELTNTSRPASS